MIDHHKIIDDLSKDYDIRLVLFLSNFYRPDGKKWLYESLRSAYQPIYKNHQRIVIIQDCPDVYEYPDLPGMAILKLQQYLHELDITNCFVLLVTSNPDVASELEQARALHSTNDVPVHHLLVEGSYEITKHTSADADTFCVLPWIHLYVGPEGNILPCCQADQKYPLGNINKSSIDDILNNEESIKLKSNMLTGRRCKECRNCYEQEDNGLVSARMLHNQRWKEKVSSTTSLEIKHFTPVSLDIRLNNICNLKCRMCSGYYSSAIAQENRELFPDLVIAEEPLKSRYRQEALEKILKFLPTVEKIYFAGGEPLLAPEHYIIIEELIKIGNTDLEIFYNTNFTMLNFRGISVLDLWKQFSNISIGASLDANGAVAEYVRHGSKWSVIEENLHKFKTQCPTVKFNVTSTLGFMNVSSLIDLQKSWTKSGKLVLSDFSLKAMISPPHLTLQVLPPGYKTAVDRKIKEHIDWCFSQGAADLSDQWKTALDYMWAEDSSHYLGEFRRLTKLMDQHRGQDFNSVFPEYQGLL